MYFDVFWLFNIIGEAIPQLIIRYVLHFETLFKLDKHLWLCYIQCILDCQKEEMHILLTAEILSSLLFKSALQIWVINGWRHRFGFCLF